MQESNETQQSSSPHSSVTGAFEGLYSSLEKKSVSVTLMTIGGLILIATFAGSIFSEFVKIRPLEFWEFVVSILCATALLIVGAVVHICLRRIKLLATAEQNESKNKFVEKVFESHKGCSTELIKAQNEVTKELFNFFPELKNPPEGDEG